LSERPFSYKIGGYFTPRAQEPNLTYQDDNRARLQKRPEADAVQLANESRWEEAVEANRNLIETVPASPDAYNRLGRALMELGRFEEAREAYAKALEVAPSNTIARKNLERLAILIAPPKTAKAAKTEKPAKGAKVAKKAEGQAPAARQAVSPDHFVKEVGKSAVVTLYRVAPREVLARMTAGDKLTLRVKGQHLQVENSGGEVLGWVEPRYEARLIKFIKGGNQYSAAMVSPNGEGTRVIINETRQDPSLFGKLSFPVPRSTELRHGKDSLLRKSTGEEDYLEEAEFAEVEEETEQQGQEVGTDILPEGFTVLESQEPTIPTEEIEKAVEGEEKEEGA
jgi:hypothetical protein